MVNSSPADNPLHVVGLTGLPSCGKGEVTRALLELAAARGWRGRHLSFSDRIKEEARRRGVSDDRFDRDLLSRLGIEMRKAEGPGVLAARIAEAIRQCPDPKPEFFVVEALRHTAEIRTLREAFGDRFVLAAVESDAEIIAGRLIARRRADESPDALESEENAVELLERERDGQLTALGPNVGACLAESDVHLENNGTLEELRECVAGFFQRVTQQSWDDPTPTRPSPAG